MFFSVHYVPHPMRSNIKLFIDFQSNIKLMLKKYAEKRKFNHCFTLMIIIIGIMIKRNGRFIIIVIIPLSSLASLLLGFAIKIFIFIASIALHFFP